MHLNVTLEKIGRFLILIHFAIFDYKFKEEWYTLGRITKKGLWQKAAESWAFWDVYKTYVSSKGFAKPKSEALSTHVQCRSCGTQCNGQNCFQVSDLDLVV